MSEWKEYKLGEIAEIVGGGTPDTSNKEYWGGNIPWLTPKDLTGYNKIFISSGERFITEEGLDNSSTKLLPQGTVLLSSRAPIGYVAIASNPICTNQGFKSIICNKDIVDNLYMYYWIKNNTELLQSLGTGTTFAEISGSVVKSIAISLPPLPEQKHIASILSSLDDKIDLLHRENATLEAMAETLFRQWFIDKENDSTLEQIISIQNGYNFKSNDFKDKGDSQIVKIKNISNGIVDIDSTDWVDKKITNVLLSKFQLHSGDVIIAMTGAEIGKLGIVPNNNRNLWLNQRVGLVVEKYIGAKYLAYLQLKNDFGQDYIENTATGSAQPNISGLGIEKCGFPKLGGEDIVMMSKQIGSFYDKIVFNLGQIRIITQTRDSLLPKLMSGEIKV